MGLSESCNRETTAAEQLQTVSGGCRRLDLECVMIRRWQRIIFIHIYSHILLQDTAQVEHHLPLPYVRNQNGAEHEGALDESTFRVAVISIHA